ncbi:MAG TPA: S41 family peptidase [Spirochaetia bacterium]|nr:S41 family peptidase [Spirochaetia bacterium]
MRTNKRWIIVSLVSLGLAFAFAAGILLGRIYFPAIGAPANETTHPAPPDYSLIRNAWNYIDRFYVDRSAIKATPLTYGAIEGMVSALGDTGHSTFLTPDMVQQESTLRNGRYVGVGLDIQMKDGKVTIVTPFAGSPAEKAGLRSGEIIRKVNGVEISSKPLGQVVQNIVGAIGTDVTLTIFSPSTGLIRDVTLTRASIVLHNISWQMIPGTRFADLRIAEFSAGVGKDLRQALAQIVGQNVQGIVLDLRNNPGGVLNEAVSVASEFLASGDVLLTRNASGRTTAVPVQKGGEAVKIPMSVLINSGTASAAEIVAGALQDAKRGPLIGETTFGTGTVLSQFPLPGGSALMLATEEWLTPSGRTIWHKGIEPDKTVRLSQEVTPLLPPALVGMSGETFRQTADTQMLAAVDSLSSPANRGK